MATSPLPAARKDERSDVLVPSASRARSDAEVTQSSVNPDWTSNTSYRIRSTVRKSWSSTMVYQRSPSSPGAP